MATGNVGYAAESRKELSFGNASGTSTMPETVIVDGPQVAKRTATVSASVLAQHLDCSRTYIGKLEAEGVIQRQGDGFLLDEGRVAYLRYLRRERRQSPRTEADAAHVVVKTEMLQLRLMEKKRELVRRSGIAARCSNNLAARRKIDAVVYQVREEMTKASLEMRISGTATERRIMTTGPPVITGR
jgi:hypothetical protein